MTLSTFTKAIEESELENGTQAQILISLFKSSGYISRTDDGISESTAKKWIDGTRNCKVSSYFPDNKLVNPEGAYKFFRRRPEDRLRKLQQIFRKEKDDNSPIDCETEDMDRFCWSLLNEFLDLLKFQRLELPTSDIPQENIGSIAKDELNRNVDAGQNPAIVSEELSHPMKCVSLKNESQFSNGCKENDVIDISTDSDYHKKTEPASLGETAAEQMSKLFEQAVGNYNIATYICKLSDYLIEEPFYAGDIFDFVDFIQTNVLSKYVGQQNEVIFKKISEFNLKLKSYCSFLGMIRLFISEKYGIMLKKAGLNNEIISLIDTDYEEIKNKLDGKISINGDEINEASVLELEERLTQLDFLRNILLAHKQLCDLFEEICSGKTILVFQ